MGVFSVSALIRPGDCSGGQGFIRAAVLTCRPQRAPPSVAFHGQAPPIQKQTPKHPGLWFSVEHHIWETASTGENFGLYEASRFKKLLWHHCPLVLTSKDIISKLYLLPTFFFFLKKVYCTFKTYRKEMILGNT